MNVKKYLFETIEQRLNDDCRVLNGEVIHNENGGIIQNENGELLTNSKPIIKTFELFADQFNNELKEDAFAYPAILFQFSDLGYKGQLQNIQNAETIFTLHIGVEDLDAYELDFLDIVEAVQFSVHGFDDSGKYFTPIYRVRERQYVSRTNVIVWEVDYTCLLQDLSTHRKQRLTLITDDRELEVDGLVDGPRTLPQ